MISILSSLMLFFSVPSFADVNFEPVDTTGEMCVRTFSYDNLMAPGSHWLSAAEQSALSRGEQVSKFFSARSGYPIGYIFRVADFDPEVAMAVYIQAEKHAGQNGLGEFIKESHLLSSKLSNPYRVYYKQHVDSPYDDGEYRVQNSVQKNIDGSYIQNTRLLDSTDASFSPRWSDGYVKVIPFGANRSFVIACNYMVPRTSSWAGTFRQLSQERLILSGHHLHSWVKRVLNNKTSENSARERLRALIKSN